MQGFPGKDDGVNPFTGVAAHIKHYPGSGPAEDGMDSHSAFGQFNVYPGGMFETHVDQFRAVVQGANPAPVMPVYSILEGQSWNGTPIEQVGTAMSKVVITDILKDDFGWDGLVATDWGAVGTGPFAPRGAFGLGSAWGTEALTNAERVALAVEAGTYNFGSFAPVRPQWQDALDATTITEAQIAHNAQKVLEVRFKVGLFENPYVDETQADSIAGGFIDEAHEAMMRDFTQDPSIQPTGTLPMEIPSSQDAVYAVDEDVPHDSADPTFEFGAGILSY